jgi:pentatricopeptide repeat protein
MGEKIHDDIVCAGLECDVCLGSCLVDMYAKCGSLSKGLRVFGALPKKDVIAYNALVIGCAQHGDHETLNDILKQMLETEMKLDSVSYLSMFLVFSHCGLLDEGCRLVTFLTQECDDELRSEHFSCIIDLLSRGGLLKDAEGVLERMPFQPSSGDWTALLSACKTYSDIEMAQFVVEMVQELDPCNVGVAVH